MPAAAQGRRAEACRGGRRRKKKDEGFQQAPFTFLFLFWRCRSRSSQPTKGGTKTTQKGNRLREREESTPVEADPHVSKSTGFPTRPCVVPLPRRPFSPHPVQQSPPPVASRKRPRKPHKKQLLMFLFLLLDILLFFACFPSGSICVVVVSFAFRKSRRRSPTPPKHTAVSAGGPTPPVGLPRSSRSLATSKWQRLLMIQRSGTCQSIPPPHRRRRSGGDAAGDTGTLVTPHVPPPARMTFPPSPAPTGAPVPLPRSTHCVEVRDPTPIRTARRGGSCALVEAAGCATCAARTCSRCSGVFDTVCEPVRSEELHAIP